MLAVGKTPESYLLLGNATAVAVKALDRDLDVLARLAKHANQLVNRFIEVAGADRQRASEVLVELEHVIEEFKRLRPPPLFKKERPLKLVTGRLCSICGEPTNAGDGEFLETPGAVYHLDCYERETGKHKQTK
jgi:hypothetical protein